MNEVENLDMWPSKPGSEEPWCLGDAVRAHGMAGTLVEIRVDGTCRVKYDSTGDTFTHMVDELQLPRTWPQFVNVYELDRVFGGHEEGGWYYTTGTPVASFTATNPAEEAMFVALADEHWPKSADSGNSNYRGGHHTIMVEPHLPKPFPYERPVYS